MNSLPKWKTSRIICSSTLRTILLCSILLFLSGCCADDPFIPSAVIPEVEDPDVRGIFYQVYQENKIPKSIVLDTNGMNPRELSVDYALLVTPESPLSAFTDRSTVSFVDLTTGMTVESITQPFGQQTQLNSIAVSSDASTVVFSSYQIETNNNPKIKIVRRGDSRVITVPVNSEDASPPAISYDNSTVAFLSQKRSVDHDLKIHFVSLEGEIQKEVSLAPHSMAMILGFSPDNKYLALAIAESGAGISYNLPYDKPVTLAMLRMSDYTLLPITRMQSNGLFDHSWLPAGHQLIYTDYAQWGYGELMIADPDDLSAVKLVEGFGRDPSLSPDGTVLLYRQYLGQQIYHLIAYSMTQHQVLQAIPIADGLSAGEGKWSPSGTKFLYYEYHVATNQLDLLLMDYPSLKRTLLYAPDDQLKIPVGYWF